MGHAPDGVAERSHRAVIGADGRPGPIEARIGRRLLRVIDPDSDEGRRLLREREVDWIAPGGTRLGRLTPREALDALRLRLERRLEHPDDGAEMDALRDGLDRLRERWRRLGHA
jgi:hypothetical protein